jgi:cobalt-zinc-cadmium efflux system protein
MGRNKDETGHPPGDGTEARAERRFLGASPTDPHLPTGGTPWRPRRGGAPTTESPYGLEEARTHEPGGEGVAAPASEAPTTPAPEASPPTGATRDTGHGHAHGPGLGGGHVHGVTEGRSLRRALFLTGTVLIVVAAGGIVSGSLALLSDAGHMLTDVSALLLALLAIRLASRPQTPKKTFGYYRLEILAALANGVALVAIAGLIVYEAIHRLREVPEVDSSIMMGVATIGLLANLGGLWFLHRDRHHSLNVRGAFLHILSDALSSMTVLVGGALIFFTGLFVIDPILSLLISVIIVIGAGRLVFEAVDVLLEATPAHIDHGEVADRIGGVEGVCGVHDLHIWTITSGMYALSVHVVVRSERIGEADEILTRIKKLLLDRYHIDHTTVQIESEDYEHVGAIC